jgi:two-component system sensor histidine kinase QseC
MATRPDGIESRLRRVLLIGLPVIWLVSGVASVYLARQEVDELFDTRQVTMARLLMSSLPIEAAPQDLPPVLPFPPISQLGHAQLEDQMVAVWDGLGRLRIADREGRLFPQTPHATGFYAGELGGEPWRLYTQHDVSSGWHVTVGQRLGEREQLILDASLTPLVPWLLALPLLLLANASVIRRALQPIRAITAELITRRPDDLRPLPSEDLPGELLPMMTAGNALLLRIAELRQRERRFTDCAAHELRTPIAALRLQWDALRTRSSVSPADLQALGEGIARVSRLTGQLLDLTRAEDRTDLTASPRVDWQSVIAAAVGDCLSQAESAGVEIACRWPLAGHDAAWPLHGDADQLQMLLRNLLDNAIRHSPRGVEVVIELGGDSLSVVDHGSGVTPEALQHLGERFYRVSGDSTPGTGLGLAIVGQIARVHRIEVGYTGTPGGGLTVSLRAQASGDAAPAGVT